MKNKKSNNLALYKKCITFLIKILKESLKKYKSVVTTKEINHILQEQIHKTNMLPIFILYYNYGSKECDGGSGV